ncbi:similar to Saccharomyces cerevisiae YMR136W GAT2 Protein containing GATA family zinc finger motifs [Maudiozyma saulgeensis]|uniref:Similar to Saccharomyces cerevisiae YMR136W GAT2 Protein containing GATA family zinc finger motifs n=1 Tax=Maudiozyma saulgeensis TaxID=1789683 RepID=A0A1X7R0H4_9SACH|nr:similar to Saccharomyces cerevisiae YMR136W GAT2 Protein containing GATA family zinc finger motifs [Kazachstania saulgeensis]
MNSSNRNGPVKDEIIAMPSQNSTQMIPHQYNHLNNSQLLQPQLYQLTQPPPQQFQHQLYQPIPIFQQQRQQQTNIPYSTIAQTQRPITVLPPIKNLLCNSYTPVQPLSHQQQAAAAAASNNSAQSSNNTGSPLGNVIPPTPGSINNNNGNNNYTTISGDIDGSIVSQGNDVLQCNTNTCTNQIANVNTINGISNVAGSTTVPTFQDPQFLNKLLVEYNKLSSELKSLRGENKLDDNKQLPSLQVLTQQLPNDNNNKNNSTTSTTSNTNSINNMIPNRQSPIINPMMNGSTTESNNSGSYYIQKANSYPHSPLTPPMSLYSAQQQQQQQQQQPMLRTSNSTSTLFTAHALCSITKDQKKKIMKKRVYNKKKKDVRLIKCFHCGEVQTPEWRRGPYGNRTLCNACGLYYRKLIKRFDTKNANLIMRFNKLINPMDRRIPLNVNVPNNIIEKFNNDATLDSDYHSIRESI